MYIFYTLIIAGISLLIFFTDLLKNKREINPIILFIPAALIGVYLLTILFQKGSELGTSFFIYYLIWSLPAFVVGVYFSYDQRIKILFKSLDIILIIGSFGIILNMVGNIFSGDSVQGLSGGTNQSLAYISAFLFGINLFSNFLNLKVSKYKFAETKIYSIFAILISPILILSTIISGGRGGMVLIILYIILFFFLIFFRVYSIKKNRIILSILTSILIFISFAQNEIIINGFERNFAYIQEGEIDWKNTSNRDDLYNETLILIKEKPLLGHGIFGYLKISPNPHNIFLEALLAGGIVYFVILSLTLISIFLKYLNILSKNKSYILLSVIMLFPFTFLLFSGTYLVSTEFWFIIGLIYSYRLKNNKKG